MIPMMWLVTLVALNGTVDVDATIIETFDMIETNVEYEFNWKPQSMVRFEYFRSGDCTEAAKFVQVKMLKYGVRVDKVYGHADCWNGTGYERMLHDWVEWNNTAYDVRGWGDCKNYRGIRTR